jgi:hypothetical protein
MTKTRQRLAIGQSNPTLRPFQGLNGWFFIDGKDERILGRIEIKTHNVGGLARKLRVSGCTNCGAVPIRCLVGAKCARFDPLPSAHQTIIFNKYKELKQLSTSPSTTRIYDRSGDQLTRTMHQ